jgi:exopolyphosphatase/guanosine-5'-triphosphate,3'-diphosphate pyrophosphatase
MPVSPQPFPRATIDIGTNSVRLLVADLTPHPPRALASGLRITRLGAGLDESGMITAASAAATVEAVGEFAARARSLGADGLFLFGTAALREAANGAEVADRLRAAAGAPVRILSGGEEAYITYRGVLMGHPVSGLAMVLDIGGGSTEFITGSASGRAANPSEIRSHSLPLGSVRHAERHIRSDPPSRAELAALHGDVRELVRRGVDGRAAERLYGVAGSVTQLVALELEMDPYDPSRVDGYWLSRETVTRWMDRLSALTVEERRVLPGIVPERAETIIAGTVILEETIAALGLEGLVVSEYDSLWGALDCDL